MNLNPNPTALREALANASVAFAYAEARCPVNPGQVWEYRLGHYKPGGRYGPRRVVVRDVTLGAAPRAYLERLDNGNTSSSALTRDRDGISRYVLAEDPNQYRAAILDARSGRVLAVEAWQDTFAEASARLADALAVFEAPTFTTVGGTVQRRGPAASSVKPWRHRQKERRLTKG